MSIALMYHDIVDEFHCAMSGFQSADADLYKVSPSSFREHLALMPLSTQNIFLTFDDAGASALHPCADLLEGFGLRGIFFVPTSYIGKPGFCSSATLLELHRRGHALGSHSRTHPIRRA